ncbi:MAG: hypothetical protein U9Q82_07110 [Chloroflexota bacterium]|nr:hypothetical protein [Chloroflexota bacterium]
MPTTYKQRYAKRRKQWIEKRKKLLPALQPHIALRNISSAHHLTLENQNTLLKAINAESIRIAVAIDYLREHPQATVEDVLEATSKDREQKLPPSPAQQPDNAAVDSDVIQQITDLIQACYTDMPRSSVVSLNIILSLNLNP